MKKKFISLMLTLGLVLCASGGLAAGINTATAVIDGKNADRVHLREEPSAKAKSLGLYFTGTEVLYDSGTNGEWTSVVIGDQAGFIESEYLYFGNNPSSVKSQHPSGVVINVKVNSWVNLRSGPHQNSASIGTLYKDDVVTVLGETLTQWYYVNAGGTYGHVLADFLQVGGTAGTSGEKSGSSQNGSSSSASKTVTATVDPKDCVLVYVTVENCTVNIVPTNEKIIRCTYNTGMINFDHGVGRGSQGLYLKSASSKRIGDEAIVTLAIPSDIFQTFTVSIQNGEASIASGVHCQHNISGTDSRISIYYPASNVHTYLIAGLINSICVVGISENATDYAISVNNIDNGRIGTTVYGMPPYQANTATYGFTSGNGNAKIEVDILRNSTLEFSSVR